MGEETTVSLTRALERNENETTNQKGRFRITTPFYIPGPFYWFPNFMIPLMPLPLGGPNFHKKDIHYFMDYLLSTCYMQNTVLQTRDMKRAYGDPRRLGGHGSQEKANCSHIVVIQVL